MQKAYEAYYESLEFDVWVARLPQDPWAEYYVELLGEPILEHVYAMVWQPMSR